MSDILETIKTRDPYEDEFCQAVLEVIDSVKQRLDTTPVGVARPLEAELGGLSLERTAVRLNGGEVWIPRVEVVKQRHSNYLPRFQPERGKTGPVRGGEH